MHVVNYYYYAPLIFPSSYKRKEIFINNDVLLIIIKHIYVKWFSINIRTSSSSFTRIDVHICISCSDDSLAAHTRI